MNYNHILGAKTYCFFKKIYKNAVVSYIYNYLQLFVEAFIVIVLFLVMNKLEFVLRQLVVDEGQNRG